MLRTVLTVSAIIAFTVGTATAQGAFDKLSPGNQKIAQALCDAQPGGCPTTSGGTTLTKDQIAAMKQHRGWGEIFKQMKANGQIPPGVKNMGQLVSGRSGTTITNGSGKTQAVGKPEGAGKSGKGHPENEAADDRGANVGRSGDLSSPGRGGGGGRGKN